MGNNDRCWHFEHSLDRSRGTELTELAGGNGGVGEAAFDVVRGDAGARGRGEGS